MIIMFTPTDDGHGRHIRSQIKFSLQLPIFKKKSERSSIQIDDVFVNSHPRQALSFLIGLAVGIIRCFYKHIIYPYFSPKTTNNVNSPSPRFC